MKTCKVCSKAMDDGYTVCPYCGAKADDAIPETEPAYSEPTGFNQPPYQNNPGPSPYGQPRYQTPPQPAPSGSYRPAPRPQRSAYIAALLAFTLGSFGVHNFYLENRNRALLQLLISVCTFGFGAFAMQIWAVIEGVNLLRGKINVDGEGFMIKMSF